MLRSPTIWLAALTVALAGALYVVWGWYGAQRADNALLRAEIERHERTRVIHEQYVRKAEQDRARWEEALQEIDGMEGGDAPLSDYLRAAAGRVLQ